MKKHNWIIAKLKQTGNIVAVRQFKEYSPLFLDADYNYYDIEELDFTTIIQKDNNDYTPQKIESNLDGYRSIYG